MPKKIKIIVQIVLFPEESIKMKMNYHSKELKVRDYINSKYKISSMKEVRDLSL